jgi:hypothetical protein
VHRFRRWRAGPGRCFVRLDRHRLRPPPPRRRPSRSHRAPRPPPPPPPHGPMRPRRRRIRAPCRVTRADTRRCLRATARADDGAEEGPRDHLGEPGGREGRRCRTVLEQGRARAGRVARGARRLGRCPWPQRLGRRSARGASAEAPPSAPVTSWHAASPVSGGVRRRRVRRTNQTRAIALARVAVAVAHVTVARALTAVTHAHAPPSGAVRGRCCGRFGTLPVVRLCGSRIPFRCGFSFHKLEPLKGMSITLHRR